MDGHAKGPDVKGLGPFIDLGIKANICHALKRMGLKKPTPVQEKFIPLALTGRDIIACAHTGSGKTLAFLIPIIQRIPTHLAGSTPRAVVLSPTRELALQITKVAETLGFCPVLSPQSNAPRLCCILGQDALEKQFEMFRSEPDLVIATPGRCLHLLIEYKEAVKTNLFIKLEVMVLDEADQLFGPQHFDPVMDICKRYKSSTCSTRQTLLLSATMPSSVVEFSKTGIRNPDVITMSSEVPKGLELSFIHSLKENKIATFIHLMREVVPNLYKVNKKYASYKCIVFVSTRHHVDYLVALMKACGMARCFGLYGNMHSAFRDKQMDSFRKLPMAVLVATDVGARGVDVPNVDLVVNFDFPSTQAKILIHRAGRTARAGKSGRCISILTNDDMKYLAGFMPYIDRRLSTTKTKLPNTPEKGEEAFIGVPPQDLVDVVSIEIEKAHHSSLNSVYQDAGDLRDLLKSMQNACKAVVNEKTGKDSLKISKEWLQGGPENQPIWSSEVHPLYYKARVVYERDTTIGQGRQEIESFLRSVRPSQLMDDKSNKSGGRDQQVVGISKDAVKGMTVLKAQGNLENFKWTARTSSINSLADLLRNDDTLVPKVKRCKTANTIVEEEEEEIALPSLRSSLNTGPEKSLKKMAEDDVITIGNIMDLQNAQIDYLGDEEQDIRKNKGVMRWDAKTKKYTVMHFDKEGQRMKKKDSAGNVVRGDYKSSGRYKVWLQKESQSKGGTKSLTDAEKDKRKVPNKGQKKADKGKPKFDKEAYIKKRTAPKPKKPVKEKKGNKRSGRR